MNANGEPFLITPRGLVCDSRCILTELKIGDTKIILPRPVPFDVGDKITFDLTVERGGKGGEIERWRG